jgi:hypothetical protein
VTKLLLIMLLSAISYADITVTAPNGGESFNLGDTMKVRWSYTQDTGERVYIDLYNLDQFCVRLKGGVDVGNDGNHDQAITGLAIPIYGNDYKVKITSTNDSKIYDFSDTYFTIGIPPVVPPVPPIPIPSDIKITPFKVVGDTVKLIWDAPPDSDIASYTLHYWRGIDNRYVQTQVTFVVVHIEGLPDSTYQKWNFAVLAEDSSGLQSIYSDSIAAYFTGTKRLYGDLNSDNKVNVYDLLQVLYHAGEVYPIADMDDDSFIRVSDILAILPLLGNTR